MTGAELALVALGIGARHATDPDHLAAIATMLDREADLVRASRLAALWGIGHGASFVAIGLPIVLLDLHVPARFEPEAKRQVHDHELQAFAARRGRSATRHALTLLRRGDATLGKNCGPVTLSSGGTDPDSSWLDAPLGSR